MKAIVGVMTGLVVGIGFSSMSVEAQPLVCSIRWCNPIFYSVGSSPSGVALGDFNGDRWTDVAVAVQGADKVSVLLNSASDGDFGAPLDIPLAPGSSPHSLAAFDIDNDTDLDLVVSREGMDDVQTLVNSSGVFTLGSTTGVGGSGPREMAIGDLDANGFMDLVTSNSGSADVSVLLNSAGVLASGVPYAVGGEPLGLAVADFDGGGSQDLLVASVGSGGLELLLNDGSGSFAFDSSLSVGAGLSPNGGVVAGDFDGNGYVDIATVTAGTAGDFATVLLNSGSASFGSPTNFVSDEDHPINDTGNPSALIAADFDLDKTLDLALTNLDSNRMANLLGDGSGSFSPPLLVRDSARPEAIAAADVDGNGSQDLVTANRDSDNIGVLINTYIFLADGFEWGDTWAWSSQVP